MTDFVDEILCRDPDPPFLNVVPVAGDTIRIDVPVTFGAAVLTVLNDLRVLGLFIGGDSTDDATNKFTRYTAAHYLNAEQNIGLLVITSTVGSSTLEIGGGSATVNGCTHIRFRTAVNNTTVIGSNRWNITTNGHFEPGDDSTYDIATSSVRTRVIYADEVNPSRIVEGGGTEHEAGDYSLAEGGFGTTASVALVDTPNDLRGIIDVTSAGTGQGANPTVVLTFADGAFAAAPIVIASRGDLSGAPGEWRITAQTTTSVTFTFNGTPVAAETYRLLFQIVA